MVHHNPGEPPYKSTYEDPSVIRAMGYHGKVYFLFGSPMLAINWESVDPEILPKGSPDRQWVDLKAAEIKKLHTACKAQDIKVYAQSDLVLFPKRLVEKYEIADTFGNPGNPLIEKFLRAQINESFDQFPDLDGLVVRIGETYLHDAPYHQGSIEKKKNAEHTIIPLIRILREEVCVKRGKEVIFRTWLSFDVNSETYAKVNAAVEPHPKLFFSMKHCEGDFHRGNPFSKVIGQGRHRQIIEVQCAREYEGKGAYPNYIARGVIEGFEEHQTMPEGRLKSIRDFSEAKPELFGGLWTWTRGGGWEGPYIKNELWCDLNAWVLAQWTQNTTQSEESIFHRYAKERLKLSNNDAENFRKLALLSADAVIRGRNSTQADMNPWWTRDHGIGWPKYRAEHSNRSPNLKEKDQSVAMWREIIDLAQTITWPDQRTRKHAIGSAHYGYHLYQIYQAIIYLEDAVYRDDKVGVQKWIKQYDQAYLAYNELPKTFSTLSSLYTQDYNRHIRDNAHTKIEKLRQK